jgi:hypothetical protein
MRPGPRRQYELLVTPKFKEKAVRRILFGLLVSVLTAVVLLAPVVSSHRSHHARSHVVAPNRPIHDTTVLFRPHIADKAVVTALRQLRAEWQHVAICEVGGDWDMTGQSYSGIGFSNATWSQYGGSQYAPLAGMASEDQQILIGMKVTKGQVPDQNGCSTTGW